jgi:hypothetical protein
MGYWVFYWHFPKKRTLSKVGHVIAETRVTFLLLRGILTYANLLFNNYCYYKLGRL